MNKQDIITTSQTHVLNTYTREPIVFVKGKGSVLTDIHGKKYLDFFPGWGVSNVGHCHPKVMAGVRDQIGKLIHIPNNLYHPFQAKLAKEIIRHSFKGQVFFCNSGAEANDGAIKIARTFGQDKRYEIITFKQSFHGRTFATLSATGQEKHHKGIGPILEGFTHVPYNDLDAVKKAITPKTAAVMLELVEGEGGVHVADKNFVRGLRELCDKHDLLLITDEVQTGMGRTGEMFAYKHYGITPDVMTLAKALGGGLPIGAIVVADKHKDILKPGMHGSTYGGGPVICKAALGVFEALKTDNMLKNTKAMSTYLFGKLDELKEKFDCITEIRGVGLMVGIELNIDGREVFSGCLEKGLIINCTQGNILRMSPALNVTKKQIDKAVHTLAKTLEEITS